MDKLDLAEAIQDDSRRSLTKAELLGPAVRHSDAQDCEVVGREEGFSLLGIACYIHREKVGTGMLFLEFL